MPTIFRSGSYRFFFFSNEGSEPVHVHVEAGDAYAKLWVGPVSFAEVRGRGEIIEAWHEHFHSKA